MGLNYVKYRNGQIFEQIKMKDENRKIKGKAFIEVFDEKGKLIECYTENVVTVGLKRSAYMDFFYHKVKGLSDTTYLNGLMNTCILSDANDIESENIILPKGHITGYAFKNQQYTGDNIYKGSFNSIESDMDTEGKGIIKFVFDYPTSSANGTINSVFWTDGSWDFNNNVFKTKIVEYREKRIIDFIYQNIQESNISNRSMTYYDDLNLLYSLGTNQNDGKVIVIDDNFNITNKININKTNARAIEYYNNKFYIIFEDNKIRVYDTDFNYQEIEITLNVTTSNIQDMCTYNNKLYILGHSNPNLSKVSIFDLENLSFIEEKVIDDTGNWMMFISNMGNNFIIKDSVNGLLVLDSDLQILSYTDKYNINCFTSSKIKNLIIYNKGGLSDPALTRCSLTPVGAYTKLPTPITKTPLNTMKVTYIFDVQMVEQFVLEV